MTLVNAETGEIVTLLTETQARRLVARINGAAAELADLIEEAWAGRAWLALGYGSWGEFIDAEVTIPKLDPPRRAEMVGALRTLGMSTRAIGSAVGVDQKTVVNDLRRREENSSPAREVTPNFKPSATRTTPAPAKAAAVEPPAPAAKVTGTDGKAYPAKSTSKPRRSSLPDAAASGGWELRKSVERLQRICDDDRFPANKEEVAARLRSHLSFTVEVCQDLLDLLGHQPKEQ